MAPLIAPEAAKIPEMAVMVVRQGQAKPARPK
jgi:hypothetical protein